MSELRCRIEAIRSQQLELLEHLREHLDLPTAERDLCVEIIDRLTELDTQLCNELEAQETP